MADTLDILDIFLRTYVRGRSTGLSTAPTRSAVAAQPVVVEHFDRAAVPTNQTALLVVAQPAVDALARDADGAGQLGLGHFAGPRPTGLTRLGQVEQRARQPGRHVEERDVL